MEDLNFGSIEEKSKNPNYLLPASILIAGVMVSASIIYAVGSKNSSPRSLLEVAGNGGLAAVAPSLNDGGTPKISDRDVVLGDPKAPVTLIEYGDYQCPFCGRFFSQTEQLLRENYVKTGKLKMVFKNLQFLGPESTAAAEAAECAKDQRQFWAYHDALYLAEIQDGKENNGNLNRDLFLKLARDLKLDAGAFAACLDGKKYTAPIQKDTSDAQALGINSTPTTFVNGQKFLGALPYERFKDTIDNFLKAK